MTTHDFEFLGPALAAGVTADLLYRRYRPGKANPVALRGFSFAVPAVLVGSYWGVIAASGPVPWTTHLWLGSVVVSGTAGVLLSYVFATPAVDPGG